MNNEIVTLQYRSAITTSLKVAEVFGKRHDHVIRDIRKIVSDCRLLDFEESSLPKFGEREYSDDRGKKRVMFEMNRSAFSILAMGFTGKSALAWKIKYTNAFDRMEKALLNQFNLSWQDNRYQNMIGRRYETDGIAEFIKYSVGQGSQNAQKYYMSITTMTHKALFLVKQSSPNPFRDLLDSMQLSFLTTAEYIVRDALEDGMKAQLFYKDIYQLARKRVYQFADTLPIQCRLMA